MANRFVNADSGVDSGSGTELSPWKTLAYTVTNMGSGDVVQLRGTTWRELLRVYYKTYASKVTIKNYLSETPIIDGSTIASGSYPDYEKHLVSVRGTPNVRLEGLTVTRADYGDAVYIITGSHNCEVVNCKVSWSAKAGIHVNGCHDVIIQGNEITHTNDGTYALGGTSEEIISIDAGTYNIEVFDNWCHNARWGNPGGGEGINVKYGAHDIWVHDNVVDQAREDTTHSEMPCLSLDGWGAETYNVYMWNNVGLNSARGGHYPNNEQGGASGPEVHDCYFWNNIIYDCTYGIWMPPYASESSCGPMDRYYMWNNTFYNCAASAIYGQRTNTGAGHYLYIQNNIFANCGANDISSEMALRLVMDHNYSGTGANFQNAATKDFRLSASTPGTIVGAGLTTLTVTGLPVRFNPATYDAAAGSVAYASGALPFTKAAVVRGAAWDLGAYEYGSATPPVGTPVLSVR
jgi:parallel beta-helix repeat protein